MRRKTRTLLLAIGCLAIATGASANQQDVAPGKFVRWTQKDGPTAVAVGGTRALIEAVPCIDADGECYRARVSVNVAGKAPVTMMGEPGIAYRIAIGRLDKDDTGASVMLESYTGGAHCCSVYTIAEPIGDAVRIVPVLWQPPGENTAGPQTSFNSGDIPFPVDLSGDGHADIVLRDDRFLYAFSSYAGSIAPPIVLSLVDGKTVDRSDDPAFAMVFADAMQVARGFCISAPYEHNGACAGYVADAARLGRLDAAWRLMLRHYDRRSTWPLNFCAVALVDGECPNGHEQSYHDYPAALRAFLVRTGYIAK